MPIRPIIDAAGLKPWLPSDYSATGWDDSLIDAALVDGNDPRAIAAEIWEDYAATLPAEIGEDAAVKKWTNLDVSVEYAGSTSPRDHALKQARHHRARAKVRTVRLTHALLERSEPEGLIAEPPEE